MGRHCPLGLKWEFLSKLAKQDVFQITLPQLTPAEVMWQLDCVGACHISREQELPWLIALNSFPQPAQTGAMKSMTGLAKGGGLKI